MSEGRGFVASIEAEYRRYKAIAEAAMAQLSDEEMDDRNADEGNSVAIVAWHLGGNLRSRFTDFLTTDGEKPWRDRDSEFEHRSRTRVELLAHWQRGWDALFDALAPLEDDDLSRHVTIRGTAFRVDEALHRSLAHASYHVGQIVHMARERKGPDWRYLSIPPGGTAAYNENPTHERPDAFTERLRRDSRK